jgi:hypothetical protein
MSSSQPARLLRGEGAILRVAATVFFWREGGSWLLFAVAFFLPDLSMLGYMAGSRIGAIAYNAVHSTILPLVLAVGGVVADASFLTAIGLIWLAHIGFDRLLGYGLKYPEEFNQAHLARV